MNARSNRSFSDEGEISDEDGPPVPNKETQAKKSVGDVWSSMIQEETLETSFKNMPIDVKSKQKMIDREAESFPAPKPSDFEQTSKLLEPEPEVDFSSKFNLFYLQKMGQQYDDYFDAGDDAQVDDFGVRSTKSRARKEPELEQYPETAYPNRRNRQRRRDRKHHKVSGHFLIRCLMPDHGFSEIHCCISTSRGFLRTNYFKG